MTHKFKLSSLALIAIVGLAATFTVSSCKKDDEPTTSQAKTLNKATFVDKLWQNEGGSRTYEFNSNGSYKNLQSVTWNWVNNSDTLTIKGVSPPYEVLIIEWNTDTEMSCRRNTGVSQSVLFKTTKW